MPFDKFVDLPTLWEERRKHLRASLRSIGIDELRKLAKEHQDEFVDNPSRDKLLRLIEERPHASFYHAVPQENIVVIYCQDEDFGLWILPGSGMGPLDETGKRHIREAIAHAASAGPARTQRAGAYIKRSQLWTVLAVLAFTMTGCEKTVPTAPVVRPVRSIAIEKRQLGDPVIVSGNVRARDEVNLAFRITGRIIERKVGVGDMVQAGQTVALLDAEVERNSRNSAKADVAAARATLDQSEAFERRQKNLLTERVISPNEYDSALRQLKTSQAQLDAAQARLKSAEEQLSYTELKSDAAGVITEKGAEVGEVVPAGQMVLKVAQQTGRDAVFNVPSQAIRDGLSLGQEGEVWLADHPEIKVDGKLRQISPQADPVTRNYQIKVELANPPPEMLLGATVLGRLKLKGESLIEIPSSALTMIEDKPAVWAIDPKDQRVHRREIVIARHAPDSVIVTDGLESGERVVTAGVQELHEGQAVKLLGGQ